MPGGDRHGGRPRPRPAPPDKGGKKGPAAAEPRKGARRPSDGPRGPLPRAPRPAFPELLAPAGSAEAYYAAVDAGADAVYLGLGKFNARERAENFNLADLCRIRPHARARGVRLYVAMNTLLTEADLPEAIGLLHQVAPLQPDAIIAADLGLVRILHEFFPGIPVHMSTQAGCASAEAAEEFARMGVSRVILERHLRKEEIARIAAALSRWASRSSSTGRCATPIPANASSPRTSAARARTAESASSRAGACTATGGSRKRSSPPATCPSSRTFRTSFPSGSPR